MVKMWYFLKKDIILAFHQYIISKAMQEFFFPVLADKCPFLLVSWNEYQVKSRHLEKPESGIQNRIWNPKTDPEPKPELEPE